MTHTTEHHVTARDLRRGDVFTLHGHERTAAESTWPTAMRGHVYIAFADGGSAVIPADRPITVTRTVTTGPSLRCTCGETACESDLCDCDSVPCPVDHAAEWQREVDVEEDAPCSG